MFLQFPIVKRIATGLGILWDQKIPRCTMPGKNKM